MMALDHPRSVLQRLIIEGETVLARRHIDPEQTLELCAAVDRLYRQPADGLRVIDLHTVMYAQALALCGKALSSHQEGTAVMFGRVIAVLIDDIRANFSTAIEQSKRPTP